MKSAPLSERKSSSASTTSVAENGSDVNRNTNANPSVDGKVEKVKTTNSVSDVLPYKELPVPWLTHLAQYLHYRANGVTSFDPNSKDPKEESLSEWISSQQKNHHRLMDGGIRSKRKNQDDKSILQQQTSILHEIQFPFRRSREERRDDYLVKLQEFKQRHGHCRVPQRPKEGEDDGGLGGWVNRIRKDYKKSKDERTLLNDDLKLKLVTMGFEFTLRSSWDDKFDELVRYREMNGHCKVPRRNPKVGKWVSSQRTLYKDGKLDDEKVNKLNGIEFCWAARARDESK